MGQTVEFTIAGLVEATAGRVPDRAAVVHRDVTRSYAELVDRARRLARYLEDRGLGVRRDRVELAGHECGQDMLAQYLHSCPEYVDGPRHRDPDLTTLSRGPSRPRRRTAPAE